jgi:hypothetical protein
MKDIIILQKTKNVNELTIQAIKWILAQHIYGELHYF